MGLLRALSGGAGGASRTADLGLLFLRLAVGYGLMTHGYSKLPPRPGFVEVVGKLGLPEPLVFAWASGLAEFLGGILIGLGLFTRVGAFFALLNLVVALSGYHRHDTFAKAELAWIYAFAVLLFLLAGPGRFGFERLFVKPSFSSPQTKARKKR